MPNKLEVEGKEILIKSSNGTMAVIPKDKVSMVKGYIDSGNHGAVDKFVSTLKEFKHENQKAGNGLYANIHAKRARIAAGSGERMRKVGEAGAPTASQFKQAAKTAKAEDGVVIKPMPMRRDLRRPDGTMKDVGFLGPLKSPSGKDVTEYSVGVPIMGKEMDIPTLVPGLSKEEINYVLKRSDSGLPIGKDAMGNAIVQKAYQHAIQRVKQGMSPFYSSVIDRAVPAMPSDATQVARTPTDKIIGGKMLPAVEIIAPKKAVEYDQINYLNPFDSKYAVTKALKKGNTLAGGNIERGGYNRESYSDLISRLEQTPGTIQNTIKNTPNIPNVPNLPFAIAAPVNLGINTFNTVRPEINRVAAASGDVVLDPVNRVPVGKGAKAILQRAAPLVASIPRKAKALQMLANASPYIDKAGDVAEAGESYVDYTKKPVPQGLSLQQKQMLNKLLKYNLKK